MADLVGRQFGNYHLIRLLGQGGFADVYLGEHVHLNTLAAIKVLRAQLVADDITNFRTEARTIAHLAHPNIVRVLEFGVEGNIPFLVMEYAPNGTLRQRHPRSVAVEPGVVVPYIKQVTAALHYAHNQKLVHRDIKPENMLLGRNNEVLLSDFGIAFVTQSVLAQSMRETSTSDTAAGTILYMAPEQIQGKPRPASDQYALAVVVYEWLCAVRPFNGSYMEVAAQHMHAPVPSLREKLPTISPDVERVILTALAKDPDQRFGSVQAFANAFEQACQEEETYRIPLSKQSSSLPHPTGGREHTMEVALHGPSGRTMLGSTVCTLGRAQDNQLVISDPKASSHHAEIRPSAQGYSIVDLGSTNGTFVNEQLLMRDMPRALNQGDAIRIGNVTLTYVVSGAQSMGRPTSDGSTVRAGYEYQGPALPPSHTGYGMGGQQEYPSPAVAPPNPYMPANTPARPLYTPPINADSTLLSVQPPQQSQPYGQPMQPPQQSQPYGQPMSLGGSAMLNTPPPVQPPYSQPISNVPPGPPQKDRRGFAGRAIILVVLALIVIIGSAGVFFIYHNNQVAQDNSNATATAQTSHNNATATALARQNATATAVANVNLTATAIATSHYPPFTNLGLNDSLTSTSSDWSSSSICQFTSTGYQVSIAQVNTFQYCLNSGTFGDFAYQVNMNIKQGDCGGLIFRHIDNNNFFLFEVCQDGTYNLADFVADHESSLYSSSRTSSVIQQGLSKQNVIAVTVQADTVNMYVNGKNIDGATVQALTSSTFSQGGVGLMAADSPDPTAVTYTNALVWTTSS
jgi:serine/threonine protein kinase